jgi:hypothetical protein
MGYTPPRKIYRIEPDDGHQYHGLVVRIRSVPLGQFLALSELADAATAMAGMKDLFGELGAALVDWNVTDDEGLPVPATAAGLHSQDFDFGMFIFGEWLDAMGGVPAPLEPRPNESADMEAALALTAIPLSSVPS